MLPVLCCPVNHLDVFHRLKKICKPHGTASQNGFSQHPCREPVLGSALQSGKACVSFDVLCCVTSLPRCAIRVPNRLASLADICILRASNWLCAVWGSEHSLHPGCCNGWLVDAGSVKGSWTCWGRASPCRAPGQSSAAASCRRLVCRTYHQSACTLFLCQILIFYSDALSL